MEVVRLPKGQTTARLVLTRSGVWFRSVTTVKGAMQGASEFGDYTSIENAEERAIDFAERHRAVILYIEDRT